MSSWAVNTSADVALTAGAAKTVLGVDAAANAVVTLKAAHINFESTTASDGVALIELISAAEEGTASSVTPVNYTRSHTAAATCAGFENHTVEPATPTVVKSWQYPVQGGVDIPLPFLTPVQSAAGGFLGFRVTAPQNQNCRMSMDVDD